MYTSMLWTKQTLKVMGDTQKGGLKMKGWSDRSTSYRMRWPISNFIIFLVVEVQHLAKICYLLNSAIWTKSLYFACQAIVRNQKGSKLLYTHFVFPLHLLPCKYCNPLGYFMLNVGIFWANLDFPNISKYYLYENAYEPLSKKSWTPAYHFLSSFYVWTPFYYWFSHQKV